MKRFRLGLGVLLGLLLTIIPASLFAGSQPDAMMLNAVTQAERVCAARYQYKKVVGNQGIYTFWIPEF